MSEAGRWLIIAGIIIAVIGAAMLTAGRFGFRGLPGDISYRSENVRFYFPIATCVVVSVVLSAGMWLFRWLSSRQ